MTTIILTFYYRKSTQKVGKSDTHIEDPHLKHLLDHNPLRNRIPYIIDEINSQVKIIILHSKKKVSNDIKKKNLTKFLEYTSHFPENKNREIIKNISV